MVSDLAGMAEPTKPTFGPCLESVPGRHPADKAPGRPLDCKGRGSCVVAFILLSLAAESRVVGAGPGVDSESVSSESDGSVSLSSVEEVSVCEVNVNFRDIGVLALWLTSLCTRHHLVTLGVRVGAHVGHIDV